MMPQLVQRHFDENYYDEYRFELSKNGFEKIGQGASRFGYKRGKTVIKVPYNSGGYSDCIMEAYVYRRFRRADYCGMYFAPCRLLPNACLMMPYLERMNWDDVPMWAKRMDGGQCGRYKDRIVAYDSAYDITSFKTQALEWAKVKRP